VPGTRVLFLFSHALRPRRMREERRRVLDLCGREAARTSDCADRTVVAQER